ncbi:MAG: DUF2155 domain-containing protein [Beijerinckiaceae bacterium]|nr:DUF2155 domain-containing protein [Beijerinckiaceae bacterium]
MINKRFLPVLGAALLGVLAAGPASADRIKNPVAIFTGLDKITGRTINFEVGVDETVQFGALQLTPRVCYTRPPTEPANTTAFIEVDEITFANEYRRIFGGWVFQTSPGLHGVEHPVYDVWLTGCKGGTTVIADPIDPTEPPKAPPVAAAPTNPSRNAAQQPLAPGQTLPPLTTPPVTVTGQGQIGVGAPQGVPVQPRAPTQRYFPTNENRDQAGQSR